MDNPCVIMLDEYKQRRAQMNYADFVESMIITEGDARMFENTMGILGEWGEVAELLKKSVRDDHKVDKDKLTKELGDVMFYVTARMNLVSLVASDAIVSGAIELSLDDIKEGYDTDPEDDIKTSVQKGTEAISLLLNYSNHKGSDFVVNQGCIAVISAVGVIAQAYDITYSDIISTNVAKLTSRKERGTIQGSGDDR